MGLRYSKRQMVSQLFLCEMDVEPTTLDVTVIDTVNIGI